jgi:DNA primase
LIPKEIIELIVDTARIDEVVSDFVNIKKRGANMIGLCPFHNEKTPSFNVNPSRNIYKCFGCGKGGDAVSFIMEHEQASYPEALRFLAAKYNIEIEEEEQTPERSAEEFLRESLLNVTSFAQKYYTEQLLDTDEGKSIGVSYFHERDISDHSINKFQLGYSQEGWSDFTTAATEAGYKIEFLEKTGITIVKDEKRYDRFHGRVMFPIHSISGKVIGFGARTLKSDAKTPKYLNSPESEIYHKSKVLYGIFFAKKSIVKKDECFLVEGYTDVISLHQSGVENVVASSGTALTTDQIRLIGRYTKNVTVLFDGDPAGIKASLRGIDLILEQGLNVRVVAFPEGEDPDSFARKKSFLELQHYLHDHATNFIRFKTSLLLKDAQNDPIAKTALIRDIMHTISLIPDSIARSSYTKECSTMMEIDEQILIQELNKIIRAKYKKETLRKPDETLQPDILITKQEVVEEDYVYGYEREIIRLLLNYGTEEISVEQKTEDPEVVFTRSVMSVIISDLAVDNIFPGNPTFRKIFEEFEYLTNNNLDYDAQNFSSHEDAEVRDVAIELLSQRHTISENWESRGVIIHTEKSLLKNAVLSSIHTLKIARIEQMIHENRDKLKVAESEGNEPALENHIQHHQALETLKSDLAKFRGIVVLK